MTSISISTSLPLKFIDRLEKAGALVRRECEIPVIELVDSNDASELYMDFLYGAITGDPLLSVTFGPILAPYQAPLVQLEVHSLLASFQPLLAAHFALGGPAIAVLPAPVPPPLGGYQYHHAQIAIHLVQMEIENPGAQFQAACPLLSQVPSGQLIADFQVTYANCAVVRRLRKR